MTIYMIEIKEGRISEAAAEAVLVPQPAFEAGVSLALNIITAFSSF